MSSNRIQILDRPVSLPGKCAVCGYSGGAAKDDRKFIDFGFDIDFYGVVYFCSSCVLSSVNVLGWISPKQVEELKSVVASLEIKVQELLSENAKLRAGLDSLSFLSSGTSGLVDNPKPAETAKIEGSSNPEPAKPTSKRGYKSLSNDVEDNVLGI